MSPGIAAPWQRGFLCAQLNRCTEVEDLDYIHPPFTAIAIAGTVHTRQLMEKALALFTNVEAKEQIGAA